MVEPPKPRSPAGGEAPERFEPKEGLVIGGWTLRRQLGKGGMGQVWKVDRPTAAGPAELAVMKLPLSNAIEDESTLRRAALEAKAMYLLQGCPNVVKIKDMGVHRGVLFYIVMEYVHGADLGEVIRMLRRRREKLAPETAAWIAGEIGAGLKAIHNLVMAGVPQNLRHLDIALKNILVSTGGEVKVGDFGLASGSGDPDLTNRGSFKYMAPEHYFGVPSQKSDLYSLGVVLWELLERDHYRFGMEPAELRAEITSAKVRELRRTDVSPQLASLVHDCLSHNEHARPSIDQFMHRLERVPEYRMQRSPVAELIARCFERLRTSGHTEVIENKEATVTADLAGLMAASEVLIAGGASLELSEVFRGVPKPRPARGYVSPTGGVAESVDGPVPPGLFGAPNGEEDPDSCDAGGAVGVAESGAPVVARPPAVAAAVAMASPRTEPVAPLFMAPAGAPLPPAPRFVPPVLEVSASPSAAELGTVSLDGDAAAIAAGDRTTRLPDGSEGLAMGPPPGDGIEVHRPGPARPAAPRATVVAPIVTNVDVGADPAVAPVAASEGEPPWPLLADQRGGTGPRPEPVLPTDRVVVEDHEAASARWRPVVVGAAAVSFTLALATVTALALVRWSGDEVDAGPTVRRGEVGGGAHAAPARTVSPPEVPEVSGPVLRPIDPSPPIEPRQSSEPSVTPAPTADAAGPARGDVMPAPVVPVPAPSAPEPTAAPSVVPAVAPASPTAPGVATTPKPKPKKPAPAVMVPVEVRNTLVKPGIEVKIGKTTVTTTGSVRFEIAAGRHRVQWREVGTTVWIDAGKFELAAGRSHLFVIGKISYPHGVRHVPQELR